MDTDRLAEEQLDRAPLQYRQLLRDSGCKFVFKTDLFGKTYVWMKDTYGVHFLEKIPEPKPDFVSAGPFNESDLNA
jgi:hypothetical protein